MSERKIDRYEIKAELGRGGMSTVYHAYDPLFQREVALKVLPPQFLHDPTFKQRFILEAQTVAALEHAAIVPVYDFGEIKNIPFLVMRYLPGGSLTQRLKKEQLLPLSETVRIIQRLAPALDEAHARGVIHRDLKPDNILFDQRNDAFITDFGIAKLSESRTDLTTGGLILGTPAYMSPEQASGMDLDGRSDIYALGVILFQMLSGRLPFEAKTPVALIMQHMTQPIPPILEVNPELPLSMEDVITHALAKDREERYATAAALADDLLTAVTRPHALKSHRKPTATKEFKKIKSISGLQKTVDMIPCPGCGTSNLDTRITCSHCGARLKVECPVCYTLNPADAVACLNCETDLVRALTLRTNHLELRKRQLAERDQAFRRKLAGQFKETIPKALKNLDKRSARDDALRQLSHIIGQATEILIEHMQSDYDIEERLESVTVLEQIYTRREIPAMIKSKVFNALVESLADPEPEIVRQIEQVLRRLGHGRNREISDIFKNLVNWIKGD
jgi:predicted Ser/Thr protein kinase